MQRIFIISDLHLGGAPADSDRPSFQMCGPLGQKRLADFITWVASQRTGDVDVHLVIAGDIVDLLAERGEDGGFQPFAADEDAALAKLTTILGRTAPVWSALRALLEGGGALTLMLGNHDVELSLPRLRRALLDKVGPGRVDFVYDNQALSIGPVLIEHGNRYDGWNCVPHDVLRQVRSSLSRGEAPPAFEAPPGSHLVAEVMNPLKQTYAFIDLLKPETSVLLPFLALLDRDKWDHVKRLVALGREARKRKFDERGRPVDPANIAAQDTVDDELLRRGDEIALGTGANIAASGASAPTFRERWSAIKAAITDAADDVAKAASRARRRGELGALYRALRPLAEHDRRAFDVGIESEEYLQSVRTRAGSRFEIVIYGHTHLAKDIALEVEDITLKVEDRVIRYLNTGTWADLIRLPDAIFGADTEEARESLEAFADAVASNQIERFRKNVPTFAQIDLDGESVEGAGVYFFLGCDSVEPISTKRLKALLEAEDAHD